MKKLLSALLMGLFFTGYGQASQDFVSTLEAARQGDVQAMVDVGVAYYKGRGTLKDPFKAKCWVQKAYQQGAESAEKVWEDLKLWQFSGKCDLSFDDELLPRYMFGDLFIEPVTRMKFVYMPKGCFQMGCYDTTQKCDKNEKPAHKACLDGFWIGVHEVTQRVWKRVMNDNPSRFSSNDDHPVENISFDEVAVFIRRLNRSSQHAFALPTEAQWEYACRSGGKKDEYPWDGDGYRPLANCGNCSNAGFAGRTAPVGSFYPNDAGLYDMGGNVKEWCKDVFDKKAYAAHSNPNPEYKERGAQRVVRGGSFTDNAKKLRCTARDKSIPTIKADNIGFRLILIRSE